MKTTLTVTYHKDELLEVSTKSKYNPKIPYHKRIGFPMEHTETDILDLLGNKYFNNAPVTWLLWKLVKLCDTKTNISVLRGNTLTSAEKQRLVAAYSILNQDNIIIRTKREHYLINPKVFLPHNNSFDEVLEHWLSLGGK